MLTLIDTRDEIYIRYGIEDVAGESRLVHIAHRDASCDYCDAPLKRESRHPLVDVELGIHEVCGDYFVRLVD